MTRRSSTLLTVGHPAWAALDAEKRAALSPAGDVTVEELLRRGIRLSRQAARLRRAVRDEDAPARS
jgi:hypothetical protein